MILALFKSLFIFIYSKMCLDYMYVLLFYDKFKFKALKSDREAAIGANVVSRQVIRMIDGESGNDGEVHEILGREKSTL